MAVQLLGMMGGASGAPKKTHDCGFFLLVINPELLSSAEDYQQRVAEFADNMRSTRPVDPSRPVRVPFERSAADRNKRRSENRIEVADEVHHALRLIVQAGVNAHKTADAAS